MLTESSLRSPTQHTQECPSLLPKSSRLPLLALLAMALVTATTPSGNTVRAQQLPSGANEFARDVLRHEIGAQSQDNALWCYCEQKQDDGTRKLLHVCQTKQGEIDRVVAVGGQSLTPGQLKAEDHRIEELISRPAEMRQRQKKEHEDAEQARNLLRMFPDAFRFQYDGTQGSLVRLEFTPNPKFRPSDHAAKVFHHMTGTMLIDPQQKRLASIDGVLTSEVKFVGGVFGHLDKGGTFSVRQEEVNPHFWEVTAMHVHMHGKALLFKTIAVQEDETYSDFHSVPGDTTLLQAAEFLKQQDSRGLPQAQAKN
jgi:hypothetical protein